VEQQDAAGPGAPPHPGGVERQRAEHRPGQGQPQPVEVVAGRGQRRVGGRGGVGQPHGHGADQGVQLGRVAVGRGQGRIEQPPGGAAQRARPRQQGVAGRTGGVHAAGGEPRPLDPGHHVGRLPQQVERPAVVVDRLGVHQVEAGIVADPEELGHGS
jgi:hypothetical protein